MKTTKMSLANIQGKLSRAEMKNIMAGSGESCGRTGDKCYNSDDCCYHCVNDGGLKCT